MQVALKNQYKSLDYMFVSEYAIYECMPYNSQFTKVPEAKCETRTLA